MTILCAAVCIFLAVLFHRRAAGWKLAVRPCFGDFIAGGAALWIFALFLLLVRRPLLSALICFICILGLWACNEAKKKSLRGEPLVFSDVTLLIQACRFPSLYLPFLPVAKMLAALAAGCAAGLALWKWEAPVYPVLWQLVLAVPAGIALIPLIRHSAYISAWLAARLNLTFNPATDAFRYGPLGAAALHFCWHMALSGNWGKGVIHTRHSPHPFLAWKREALPTMSANAESPDIFLVQAESFCDPRGNLDVPEDILANYDAVCREATYGTLVTNAFGAYTMRTEFSVLTGIPPKALGSDAFNPYLAASRAPLWSLARCLGDAGYRTVCIHPFAPSFFLRHKAIPNMGFDHFITSENMPAPETFGPYTADAFVARMMLDAREKSEKPLFCFAITMEAHGPWHKQRFSDKEAMRGLRFSPELSDQEFRYLTHLKNADNMIGALLNGIRTEKRSTVLGWYGDHLPGLPRLAQQKTPGTPYFVWSDSKCETSQQDIRPEHLGEMLLTAAG